MAGYMKDLRVCDCDCHTNPNIHHMMPCCDECPWCKERIVIGWYETHKKSCPMRSKIETLINDQKITLHPIE